MDLFVVAHGWGEGLRDVKRKILLRERICRTYPTMMKLGTVILYLQKIQKIYKPRDTSPEFC